jgi:hypothetical protein
MPSSSHTLIAICLAAAVLVVLGEFSAAQQQSIIPGTPGPPTCTVSGAEKTEATIFETGAAKVVTGCDCGRRVAGKTPITLEGTFVLPAFANRATVFLSGWKFDYLGTDHKVAQIETHIDNIRLQAQKLRWTATGILRDKNFDDTFDWCYYYTALAWDDTQLAIRVNDGDELTSNHTIHTHGEGTAMAVLPSFSQVSGLTDARFAAVLPRGFGFSWGTLDPHDPPGSTLPNNNLLQLAYNLTHRELFVYPKGYGALPNPNVPESQVDASIISWETHGIFKDNRLARIYRFMEVFSVLSGDDVRVTQPPFTILPIEDQSGVFSGCISTTGSGVVNEKHEIANIPYDYAIPMLTGWNLSFECDDQHVSGIGAWLSDFSYEKPPASTAGRLRYTVSSILHDRDNDPGFSLGHKVDILGLRLTPGGGTIPRN